MAVLGSGIDARNAQFAPGQVLPGRDLLGGSGPADDDCDGSGTFVAGLVAARPDPGTTVVGLAPGARLLPLRILQSSQAGVEPPAPDLMAAGIEQAVAAGADIIVSYEAAAGASAKLQRAVAAATRAGSVVVAGGRSTATTSDAASQLYPCDFADVLAVAGVDDKENPVAGSCSGPRVDLAAPGAGLVSTSSGSAGRLGHVNVGAGAPGYAAGYVAGALALQLSYEPGLTPRTAAQRLTRTADLPPSGRRNDRVGWGVVNPYAAMSDLPPVGANAASTRAPESLGVPAPPSTSRDLTPIAITSALLVAAVGSLLITVAVRAGRVRDWRPGRKAVPGRVR